MENASFAHAAEAEERETVLYHTRHAATRLLELGDGAALDANQEEILHAAIFHQHRHVRALALGVALACLLALSSGIVHGLSWTRWAGLYLGVCAAKRADHRCVSKRRLPA